MRLSSSINNEFKVKKEEFYRCRTMSAIVIIENYFD